MSPLPPPQPPRRQRRTAAPPPPVAERLRGALLGLWLGDLMGHAMRGRNFPHLPEFPALYAKPQETGPPRAHPRDNSLALGFAACVAHCLLQERQFQVGSLLKTYRRHAAFLQNAGKLAPLSPPETAPTPTPPPPSPPLENEPPLPSLEPALAKTLETFPLFHSPQGFLEVHLRNAVAPPVFDGVLLRSVPVACFFYADAPARIGSVMEEALATQTGPLGALASVALAALLSESILSPQAYAPTLGLLEAIQRDMAQAAPALMHRGLSPAVIQQALAQVNAEVEYAQRSSPNLYAPALNFRLHAGQLRLSFRLALWELFHAPEPSASDGPGRAIEDVVCRGGSPASQGALTAALCGARWGRGCLPNPGLEPLLPLPPRGAPLSCGDASFLGSLAEALVATLN